MDCARKTLKYLSYFVYVLTISDMNHYTEYLDNSIYP